MEVTGEVVSRATIILFLSRRNALLPPSRDPLSAGFASNCAKRFLNTIVGVRGGGECAHGCNWLYYSSNKPEITKNRPREGPQRVRQRPRAYGSRTFRRAPSASIPRAPSPPSQCAPQLYHAQGGWYQPPGSPPGHDMDAQPLPAPNPHTPKCGPKCGHRRHHPRPHPSRPSEPLRRHAWLLLCSR